MQISAAPKHVRLAGEDCEAASPGVKEGHAAAPAAAALADDESDDEADREVKSCQLTLLLIMSQQKRSHPASAYATCSYRSCHVFVGSSHIIKFAVKFMALTQKRCIVVTS